MSIYRNHHAKTKYPNRNKITDNHSKIFAINQLVSAFSVKPENLFASATHGTILRNLSSQSNREVLLKRP